MPHPLLTTAGFSAREAAKQLILLEDHLACPDKQCPDCISKHKLSAEAFAEEALALDGAAKLPWLAGLPRAIRSAQTGPDFRGIRKELTANLRDQGMIGLGRMRALGAIGDTYYLIRLLDGMDPYSWSQSDPALKLNMTMVQHAGKEDTGGVFVPGAWLAACAADPATVAQLLHQDPRVISAELLGGETQDPAPAYVPPSYVGETRPAPGQPAVANAGYIPKLPNDPTKSLSVVDQALAQLPAGAQAPAQAAIEQAGKLPWWVWGLAYLALKGR